jgi:D-alanyl-D-alanine carboxypeptidase
MDQTDIELKLQSEIDEMVRKNTDVFSAVLGITNATGDFMWTDAAGTAYPDKSELMKVDTPIFIASITKMYTATVALILDERKILSLDDSISNFLPASLLEGLHRYKGRDYTDQLRVYHLISQTSGLPDYFTEKPENEESILDRIVSKGDMEWDVEDVVRIVRSGRPAKFPPEPKEQERSRNRAYYSDTNYQLLGAIIETFHRRTFTTR